MSPARVSRIPPPSSVPALLAALPGSHGVSPSVTQAAQCPHRGRNVITTRWPTATSSTPCADLLDDPGRLVPEQHRHGPHPVAVHHRQIGMAHACGLDADQQLVGAGWRQLEVGDRDGPGFGVRPGRSDLLQHGAPDFHMVEYNHD